MILRKLKVFRPDVFVLVYLDSSFEYFEKLCSIIAKEELATIAFDEDDKLIEIVIRRDVDSF